MSSLARPHFFPVPSADRLGLPVSPKTIRAFKMSGNSRVLNLTRGYTVKYKHALRGIEQCAVAWVEEGVSVRDLTLAESITKRNEQAKLREPLCYAELPGVVFRPPMGAEKANALSSTLVWEAHRFVTESAEAA